MIKKILLTILPLGILGLLSSSQLSDNGKAGRTGAPGESSCVNSCHSSFALNSGPGSISLQSSGMTGFQYTPGQTYTMSVTVSQSGVNLFGVGVEALKNTDNTNAGTLTITDAASTSIKNATVSGVSRRNVVHTLNGGASAGSKVFNFSWTAPAQGTGDITFYFAGVAANGNGNENGDYVYNSSQVFQESCQAPAQPAAVTGNLFVCEGGSATYSVPAVSGANSYSWTLPSGWTGTSTTNSITVSAMGTSGVVSVSAINTCGASTPSTYNVTVNPLPVPVITLVNDTLFSSNANAYQWYLNGNAIGGATSSYYLPVINGTYSVEVTDPNTTCTGVSADFILNTVGFASIKSYTPIDVYPNPARDKILITIPESMRNANLTIYNLAGQIVLQTKLVEMQNAVDLKELMDGVYTLVAVKESERAISRILISKD